MNAKRTFGGLEAWRWIVNARKGDLWQLSNSMHKCSGQRVLQNLGRKDMARRNFMKMKKKIF